MINLLPYEDKKEVKREGLRRFAIVAVFSISAVLLLSMLLMAPAYFFLYQERASVISEENLLRASSPVEKMNEIADKIKKTNSRLSVIESLANNRSVPEDLKKIIDLIPPGVSVNGISFARQNVSEQGRVSLSGKANTREDLASFIGILNDSDIFSKVDSPVSNILKKNNIDFLIKLEFK
ncbi:MAG: hypothetical protein UX24_C0014G0007 [Candidatus Giovannonibacteria bacterium GW2011_GWB1_45_9b]|uniref:Uncharacterized protein n=7 Tax=Candidatus Giovannoniibacteriota TaxID=1752738 RepID=A0A1F5WXY1_9BACT|nr:MAG: hypothetical protein UW55_C0014G0004 [Candidatus Giovannonibacteria bacterium GW2011_GWA2_44_26]KKT77057.1 MAG: hypothetical protein UW74_C0050G0004 [Candidatus Giovannonibacteria bacterium GW2011_GWC2_44_8]KKU16279.1 MAG: hypothetical protein UX24_C0014G0007 [Candidatus Giovannonibacteria bacterium GW2011_GWB1_45_9b]OGF73546.1 MAG: hypothetical protein A2W57_03325 [Candidatus Giovannonibacteria bacterium RIFCSPHIGHO2_02_43_16]OGF80490.1 MAG: hypothetical protein A2W48_00935 [Candidatus